MAEKSAPLRTINVEIDEKRVSGADAKELADGIQRAVGDYVQSWQDRLKQRAAAQQSEALTASIPPRC